MKCLKFVLKQKINQSNSLHHTIEGLLSVGKIKTLKIQFSGVGEKKRWKRGGFLEPKKISKKLISAILFKAPPSNSGSL